MSDQPSRDVLRVVPPWLLLGLAAVHVVAALLVAWVAAHGGISDAWILRAQDVANSPATPYRGFPMASLPLEGATIRFLAGGASSAATLRFVLIALASDLAVAGGLTWGWGRRPAATYLVLSLPLLSVLFLRLDLVAVAMAVWAIALLRRRDDDPVVGATLGLAILWKLWPAVLTPLLLFRRARRAAVALLAVGLTGGVLWYLTGGPKGPFQVITFRGAQGWSVEGTVGSILWLFGGGPANPDGLTVRLGTTPTWQLALLGLGLGCAEVAVWWRGLKDDGDPTGAASLAAVATLLVFAPVHAVHYALWLAPWAAIAFEGRGRERHTATFAACVIVLSGVLAISYGRAHAYPITGVDQALLMLRTLSSIGCVAAWLWPRGAAETVVA
jgi:hypothetical protein